MASRLRGAIEKTRDRRRTQRQLTSQEEAIRAADQATYQSPHLNPFQEIGRDNYRTYPYDYYSGTDCKVFYGDVWVDDIVSIQFGVSQNKTPIFGYAAQNFNAVAKGRVMVEGTLTIAFKETGYLNLIQRITETQKANAYKVIQRKVATTEKLSDYRLAKFDPSLTYIGEQAPPRSQINATVSANGSPQLIRQSQTIEEILLGKKAGSSLLKSFVRRDGVNLGEKDRDFEDFAELLEDSIWGDSNGRPFGERGLLKRADEFDYNSAGGINVARGQGKNAEYENVLNIMLTFGDINDFRAEHTLVVLNDIHFTGTSMIVAPDGTPIAESYSFFGRDINRSISAEIQQNINPIKLDVGLDDVEIGHLEDIDAIEKKLNQASSDTPWILTMKPVAAFNEFGWRPVPNGEEIEVYLPLSKGIPLVDRMIEAVEKGFNDPQFADYVELDKSQYIIDTWFTPTETITMVLEQGIPNARTYRVIAPVRTGFRAPVVYTREDLFTNIGELPEPLDEVQGILDKNKKYVDAKVAELSEAQAKLDVENAAFGTEDELAAYRRRQSKADELRIAREDDRRKTGIGQALQDFRIDRAIQREEDALKDYVDETFTPLEDRSFTRSARDNQLDRNKLAEQLDFQQSIASADAQLTNEGIERLGAEISDIAEIEAQRQLRDVEQQSAAQRETQRINSIIQQEVDRQLANYEEHLGEAKERASREYAQSLESAQLVSQTQDEPLPTPPRVSVPHSIQREDVLVYTQSVDDHATRSNFAREAYINGQVQAIDIQRSLLPDQGIDFPFVEEVEYFDRETGTGAFFANLPQGDSIVRTRIGFAHAQSISQRDGVLSIIPAAPDRDANQQSINPLLHVQTRDQVNFQEGLTDAFTSSGTSIFVLGTQEFIKASEKVPTTQTWPDFIKNQQVNEERAETQSTTFPSEGRTGRRLAYDSNGNLVGIIQP